MGQLTQGSLLRRAATADLGRRCPLVWTLLNAVATNDKALRRSREHFKNKTRELAMQRAFVMFSVGAFSRNQRFNFLQFVISHAVHLDRASLPSLLHSLGLCMNRDAVSDSVDMLAGFQIAQFTAAGKEFTDILAYVTGDNLDYACSISIGFPCLCAHLSSRDSHLFFIAHKDWDGVGAWRDAPEPPHVPCRYYLGTLPAPHGHGGVHPL